MFADGLNRAETISLPVSSRPRPTPAVHRLLVGLAVGVDHSLFYIRREREERGAGHEAEAALQAAAATSGRTVLVPGLTVMRP